MRPFRKALKEKKIEIGYDVISGLNKYLETLGANLEVKKGRETINKFGIEIDKYYQECFAEKENYQNIDMALFDTYGLSTISLALGFFKLIYNYI